MNPADDRLPAALLDLCLVPADRPLPLVLEQVAGLATDVLGGQPALSITVLGPEGGTTVATSAQVAADLDLVQYRAGDGPCLEAVATGQALLVRDSQDERRWPDLGRAAAAEGLRSVVSMPLPSGPPVTGGLNLYLHRPLTEEAARARAEVFARHAAVPVAGSHLHAQALQQVQNLQQALESRAVIDQAKGILMERHRLTAEQAFDVLARASNRTNTKVRSLAAHLVRTGEFPPA